MAGRGAKSASGGAAAKGGRGSKRSVDNSKSEDFQEDENDSMPSKRSKKVAAPAANKGRAVNRRNKKEEIVEEEEEEEELIEEEEDEEELGEEEEEEDVEDEEISEVESEGEDNPNPNDPVKPFASRSYVMLKADYDKKTSEDVPLWRIDGQSLLQKYTAFVENNEKLYKSTSVYSGWTSSSTEKYHPIEVSVKRHSKDETVVKIEKIIEPENA